MKRIVFAAAALLAVSVPAAAQYPGGYYGDRGGGYYEERGGYGGGRRGYDRGYDRDDDDRRRRDRRDGRGYRDDRYGGPPASSRRGGGVGNTCATPRGACRVGVPTPVGTPCGCVTSGVTSRGTVQ